MDGESDTAAKACAACKQYKRRCNKALPSCSSCSRLRRVCDYSSIGPAQVISGEEITLLRARVEGLEQVVGDRSMTETKACPPSPASSLIRGTHGPTQSGAFSRLLFLDERYFTHRHCSLPPVMAPVPHDIVNALKEEFNQPGGMERLVSRYLDNFHGWMPIISSVRMKRVLGRPVVNMQAETAFLLSCMKLSLHTPEIETQPEDLPLYRTVKIANLQLEIAGFQSLRAIQGAILIAVYELGHGIYPASYITVSQCARHAISIGIHDREAPKFLQPWADWEEEVRVWWFIIMLDRHVTVGRELRPLCTEDPKTRAPLPASNDAWDLGAMVAPERLYISSPATAITGQYARLAQAYNLLGRVIRHCDDRDQDTTFVLQQMNTLHQVTSALLELIKNEEPEDSYVATAVCFSALMKLHKNFLYNSFHNGLADKSDLQVASRIHKQTEMSFICMRDIALQTLGLAQFLDQHIMISGSDDLSPLVLHCLYRGAFWLSYLAANNREDRFVLGRPIFDRVLNSLSVRWKAAGTYLKILEAVYEENEVD